MTANAESIQAEVAQHMPSMAARWYVLVMMVLVYTLSIADRYVTSTVLEPIRAELQLTNLGVSLVTAWPIAWPGVPSQASGSGKRPTS